MSTTSQVIYLGELRTEATHTSSSSAIITDAPLDNNGKGQKFSPTDLTATSLASCMITVMGIGAAKRGIAFDTLSANVLKVMTSAPRRISEIHVDLIVHNDWTNSEKKLMENIALTCPVAKSLHPDIEQKVTFSYE